MAARLAYGCFPAVRLLTPRHGATGYREACTAAKERLESIAIDNSGDEKAFRRDLLNIARTTLSSKILTQVNIRNRLCVLCVL
jgi:chaperonin GroEL (HSP60 family)